jgi:hypothetical protein
MDNLKQIKINEEEEQLTLSPKINKDSKVSRYRDKIITKSQIVKIQPHTPILNDK